MLSSSTPNGANQPPIGTWDTKPQAQSLSARQRPGTASGDPKRLFTASASSSRLDLKASISRPKTSDARHHTFERSEVPRLPFAFNTTPPVPFVDPLAPSPLPPPPSPPKDAHTRGLSSHSSLASLRSQSSDSSPRKRRRRLLQFRNRFIGAWKEDFSTHDPKTDGSAHIYPSNESSERLQISHITNQLADLPADLKPAAAKRLGIGVSDVKPSSQVPGAVVMRTGPSSVIHSRVPSRTEPGPPTSKTHLKNATKSRSYGDLTSSNGGQSRPDRSPEADPHLRDEQDTPISPQQTTFFDDANSSESEDDDKCSSGYSCGSSHTSYNVNASPDMDDRKRRDTRNEWGITEHHNPPKDLTSISSPRQSQHSISSFGSTRASGTASSGSRPASTSRSFPKIGLQKGLSHSPSGSSASKDNDGETQPPLAAIKEDAPFRTGESMESMRPSGLLIQPPLREHSNTSPQQDARVNQNKAHVNSLQRLSQHHHQKLSEADTRSARPLSLAVTKQSEALISADSAEAVILHIFETIDNFKDLFACARLNKGFYKVFKRHELRLMKNTLRNMSTAQWEYREASPTAIIPSLEESKSDYTPTRYVQFHKRDAFVLMALKSMILARCQAFLRFETVNALSERDTPQSTRVDDALWRIWTFCTIFGSDRGREHDITGQMDWLRGGPAAHRPTSPSSLATSTDARSSCTLTRTSESFGRGNYGGLTVDELYDMTEMWNCIRSLLQGILGKDRHAQARKHGVFNNHSVDRDMEAQGAILEEWMYYLTSLGLSTVVDLAYHSNSSTDDVFSIANDMEWTQWSLPEQGMSRINFLQEPVTRIYEEKTTKAKELSVEQMQAKRKSRGYELAAELREAKTQRIRSQDPLAQHPDESINVWLEWMAKVDGTNAAAHEDKEVVKKLQQASETEASRVTNHSSLPRSRQARSNSSLSLFPSVYKTPTPKPTPRMSPMATPKRSRNNSRTNFVLQPTLASQEHRQNDRNHWEQEQPFLTRPLSICQET